MAHDAMANLIAHIEAKPGATGDALGPAGQATLYKVCGKMFAIVSVTKKASFVNVKCDPHLVEILKEQYEGIGHHGHLDRRFWIAVTMDTDVPPEETMRLVDGSYDLIVASLTKKQRAEVAALA